MHKMIEILEREIDEIAKNGLSTSNIDRAYKLIDMYDNLHDAKYKEAKEQMMGEGSYSRAYENDNSYGHRRYGYSRDGYSRGDAMYDKYMDSKREYRYSQSAESKNKLMSTLEDYMDDFSRKMETMMNDAEFADERDTIQRYLNKIKSFK